MISLYWISQQNVKKKIKLVVVFARFSRGKERLEGDACRSLGGILTKKAHHPNTRPPKPSLAPPLPRQHRYRKTTFPRSWSQDGEPSPPFPVQTCPARGPNLPPAAPERTAAGRLRPGHAPPPLRQRDRARDRPPPARAQRCREGKGRSPRRASARASSPGRGGTGACSPGACSPGACLLFFNATSRFKEFYKLSGKSPAGPGAAPAGCRSAGVAGRWLPPPRRPARPATRAPPRRHRGPGAGRAKPLHSPAAGPAGRHPQLLTPSPPTPPAPRAPQQVRPGRDPRGRRPPAPSPRRRRRRSLPPPPPGGGRGGRGPEPRAPPPAHSPRSSPGAVRLAHLPGPGAAAARSLPCCRRQAGAGAAGPYIPGTPAPARARALSGGAVCARARTAPPPPTPKARARARGSDQVTGQPPTLRSRAGPAGRRPRGVGWWWGGAPRHAAPRHATPRHALDGRGSRTPPRGAAGCHRPGVLERSRSRFHHHPATPPPRRSRTRPPPPRAPGAACRHRCSPARPPGRGTPSAAAPDRRARLLARTFGGAALGRGGRGCNAMPCPASPRGSVPIA